MFWGSLVQGSTPETWPDIFLVWYEPYLHRSLELPSLRPSLHQTLHDVQKASGCFFLETPVAVISVGQTWHFSIKKKKKNTWQRHSGYERWKMDETGPLTNDL